MSLESDVQVRPVDQFDQSMTDDEKEQLVLEQTQINRILGIKGIYANEVTTDESLVPNLNHQTILMYLQSKDDNLLLQLGGLIHTIIVCDPREEIKSQLAVIFGGQSIEDPKHFGKVKTQADLIDCCVEAMFMVPPYRNFTIKVFLRTLRCLRPDFQLTPEQNVKLIETL